MAQLTLNVPSFAGLDLSDERQLRKLTAYLYRLDEQLKYVLNNLGEENLSDSLRTIINTKTDAQVLNEMTGRLQRLSTQINQTAEKIALKAEKTELDALGDELTASIAELEVTAGEIRLAVSKKLDADAPSVGVVTSSAVVNEKGVYLTGGEIDMRTTDGEDYLNLSSAGGEASSLRAPDVTPRYAGPAQLFVNPLATSEEIEAGGTYRSLQEALDSLSGRVIAGDVMVALASGMMEYGAAVLQGAVIGGQVSIVGNYNDHATLLGGLMVKNCAGRVSIGSVDVQVQVERPGILVSGPGIWAVINNCTITGGDGSGNAIEISDGARTQISGCEMYYCPYSVCAAAMGMAIAKNNAGNCQICADAGMIFVTGSAPCNQSNFVYTTMLAGQVFSTPGVTVDQGSAGSTPTIPTIGTIGVYAEETASYDADGDVWSDDNVTQGWWEGGGRIRGVMWFDNAAIRGMPEGASILSATLRLTMKTSGRGTQVTVELAGTSANAGGDPVVTKTYGAIATMSPKETATITLPKQVVTDLVSGDIDGLMLYSSDEGSYKERDYSKNYAAFTGTDGDDSTKPMLTITYYEE